MVTLKDIAKEAGVSVMTVSNVVNGNLAKVSKENAERIQAILANRRYIPNSSARSLAKSNSNIIAIVLRCGHDENSMQSPHNATLVGAIIQRVQALGYYTMVHMVKSQEAISQSLRTWNVEGAIFLGMFDDEIERIHQVNDIPMVFIDSYSDVRQLSNVGIDDFKGGQLAAQRLLDGGHTRLAFISPPNLHNGVIQHRLDGFLSILQKRNITLNPRFRYTLESDSNADAIIETGKALAALDGEVTAAFVTSDQIASYVIQGLKQSGMHVPKDFSIIGFDNMMISTQITPQLTTISQNLDQKADLAVDILFRRLKNPDAPAELRILNVALVERSSVRTLC